MGCALICLEEVTSSRPAAGWGRNRRTWGRLQSVAAEYTVAIMWRVSNASARHQEQVEHIGFGRSYDATMNIEALKLG